MKTTLKKEVIVIRAEFEEEIEKLSYMPVQVRNELKRLFSSYNPVKERAYFFKRILESLNVDNLKARMFYLGIESAFISYYCKDDIIDNTEGRALDFTDYNINLSNLLLHSDMLLEFSHYLLNSFVEKTQNIQSLKNIHIALQQLSLGQLLSLNITIEDYPDPSQVEQLCYFKSGALYENGISILSKLFENQKDFQILKTISNLFGTGSQIRNDIEDFIVISKNSNNGVLEDISNGQANYVLSHFFNCKLTKSELQEIKKYFNKKYYSTVENQDLVFELLESKRAISKSIIKLNNIRVQILEELGSFSDDDLAKDLSLYTEHLLSIHPNLNL